MTTTPRIGANLSGVAYWSTEEPFLDRMKSAGSWVANGATEPLVLDARGYPTAIPAGATSVYCMVPLDPLSAGTSDDYVLTWSGGPDKFFVGSSETISSEPGRLVFRHIGTEPGGTLVATDKVDGLSDMRLVRDDQEAALAAGAIFNPAFTAKVSQMDTLRYMDWGATNASTAKEWSDRTTPDHFTWGTAEGVPIETMVALANETHTNMWLNVPTYASDDYVRQMMAYVRDHLDPSLLVDLEYSNEVWNFQFQQSGYAAGQGAKLWDKDANGDGKIDEHDSAEHDSGDWVIWAGYRAAQIAAIAREVFAGQLDRLSPVLATQTGWTGLEGYIVEGVRRAGLGGVGDLFGTYAITTYFGLGDGTNPADVATIIGWAKSGEEGLVAAFRALEDGTGLVAKDQSSLAFLATNAAYHFAAATKLGLDLVAYEGGLDVSQIIGLDPMIADLIRRMQADPRMGAIYAEMVATFAAQGGTLLNVLIDIDAGFYGTLKSVYDEGSPEWDALVAAEKAARAGQVPPAPVVAAPMPPAPAPAPTSGPVPDPVLIVSIPSAPAPPTTAADALLMLVDEGEMFLANVRKVITSYVH